MVKWLLIVLAVIGLSLCAGRAHAQDQILGGTLAANGATLTLPIDGRGSGALQIDPSCTCTIQFEATIQAAWFSLPAFPVNSTTAVTSTTTAGQWVFGASGYRQIRVRVSAYTGGTATVGIRVSSGSQVVTAATTAGGGGTTIITDGAGAGQADVIGIAPTTEQGLVVRNIPSGTQTVSGTLTVTGALTDAELRATPVPMTASALAAGSGSTLVTGSLTATVVAQALGAGAIVQVLIQSDPTNGVVVLVGGVTTQVIQLHPGFGITLNVTNLNVPYVRAASGTATVTYLAR